ncbi:MAG: glycosyltransferase family 4 protein [Roseateles sp.]|uniref:glycosyltransferase family 4 protein n=1 Tax=Roseateles sp. TaxID=1971397 RepID=UPI0039EB4D92
MRIAAISYPALFQAIGGLQVQMLETVAAVRRTAHDMVLIDPVREKFTDFDLLHVFACVHGNYTLVRRAQSLHVPVVVSSLMQPHWTRTLGMTARGAERVLGRLTGWHVRTEYSQMWRCLHWAERCVSLGRLETQTLQQAFQVPAAKIAEVPNGVPPRFFDATPDAALAHYGLRPGYVLCVGSVNSHKNQLGLGRQLVLVGQCLPADAPYLKQVLELPDTRHLGALCYDDPLLPGLYAGAGVLALVSQSEVMPLVVLEALAAGVPAVMTRRHGMGTAGMAGCLTEVDPDDTDAIRRALQQMLADPPDAARCRATVAHLCWDEVAQQLLTVYQNAIATRAGSTPVH